VVASVILGVVTVVVVAIPVASVAARTTQKVAGNWAEQSRLIGSAFSLEVLVNTGVYAGLIGVLATVIGAPAAWVIGRSERRTAWIAAVTVPLLLPSYLAYAGWGLLRGPNTSLGDWLSRQQPYLTTWVGKAMAVMGMVLWVWPLAAVVLAGSVRSVGAAVDHLARLDAPTRRARWTTVAWAMREGIALAIGAVALVMVGSAIPLHVAQVPTYAINLWKVMQLTAEPAGIWVAALPLLGLAAAAAWVLARRLPSMMEPRPEAAREGGRGVRWARVGLVMVLCVSVGIPLVLFFWSLQSWASLGMFWRISGAGVAQSLRVAGIVGGSGIGILLATWLAVDQGGRWGRRAAVGAAAGLLFTGLSPGVLVGAALGASWGAAPLSGVMPGVGLVVVAHLARFGFLAAVGGWWLASMEPREHRWLRQLDGGSAIWAWLCGAVWARMGGAMGIGMCVAALSFQEIESTVMVTPPGLKNLPQQLLDSLHYARDEQLSAAAVNLVGIGTLIALAAGWLVARSCNGEGGKR